MEEGHCVKLPEWIGKWFMDKDGNIKVETRAGDILYTPWIDDNAHRKDWQVGSWYRRWPEAQFALEAHKCIRRADWPDGHFVFMRPLNVLSQDVIGKLNSIPQQAKDVLIAHGWSIPFSAYLCKWDGECVRNAWQPSNEDLLVAHWEIVR